MSLYSKQEVVWKVLEEKAGENSDKGGYIFQNQPISFKQVNETSDRLASAFLKMGFKRGDRVGVIGLNQPEWLYTYFAAAKIGVIVVALNVRYRELELEYMLNQSKARAVVSIASLADMSYVNFFQAFREKVPTVADYVFIGGDGSFGKSLEALLEEPMDRAALDKAKAEVVPDDPIMIIYTSGTTGRPKGAILSNKSQLASARAQAAHQKAVPGDLCQLALPLNHVGGITCGIITTLLGGGTVELIPFFDPAVIIRQAKAHPPTLMNGVPTMHTLLLMNPDFESLDTSSVRLVVTGGSNSEPALLNKLYEKYPNAAVMNLYGLSEASGALVLSPWDSGYEKTLRSIGKPIGDFRVKVVDVEGAELPAGEVGELHFKGGAVGPGYYDMPEETSEAFDRDGWLHTGDMGFLDDEGYINLMGRLKEMYLQGGYNVYPVEVENHISKHPKVAMVAGIGVPDTVLGEVGRYYIIPKPGEDVTEEEIKSWCRESLADYKTPRQVVFTNELPLTPVGKVMKSKLKEDYLASGQ